MMPSKKRPDFGSIWMVFFKILSGEDHQGKDQGHPLTSTRKRRKISMSKADLTEGQRPERPLQP